MDGGAAAATGVLWRSLAGRGASYGAGGAEEVQAGKGLLVVATRPVAR